jgi:hypothetical protein
MKHVQSRLILFFSQNGVVDNGLSCLHCVHELLKILGDG